MLLLNHIRLVPVPPLDTRFLSSTALSFIRSGYFYSASSSQLLLRGALDYSVDTVSG